EPNSVPLVYQTADPRVTQFETSLWRDFWRLADDATYRAKFGGRVATGQGVFGPLVPERLYTLTLESTGGLNVTSEPMKGIYREALQPHGAMSIREVPIPHARRRLDDG